MEIISKKEFAAICNQPGNKVLKFGRSYEQPKIYETTNNTIIKLFYPKRRKLSSSKFRPQAVRFCQNIEKLHQLGYSVPRIVKIQRCPELKIYLVHYEKVNGIDVRLHVKNGQTSTLKNVAKLFANLHSHGIIFRSIHLENLLHQQNSDLALIDVADVRFKKSSLSLYARYRNIKHLLQNEYDAEIWQQYGLHQFLNLYFDYSGVSKISRWVLETFVSRKFKHLIAV